MEAHKVVEQVIQPEPINPQYEVKLKTLQEVIDSNKAALADLEKQIDSLSKKSDRSPEEEDRLESLRSRHKYISRTLKKAIDETSRIRQIINTSKTVETITKNLQAELNNLPPREAGDETVRRVQEQISELTEQSRKLINIQAQQSVNNFAPDFTILTPKVKLVDANLAYKFADAQSDTNILLGFASLIFGVTLSTAISLGLALIASADKTTIAVYIAITISTLLFSVGLAWLTYRAYGKAEKVKKQLENDADEKKVALSIAFGESVDSNDTIEK